MGGPNQVYLARDKVATAMNDESQKRKLGNCNRVCNSNMLRWHWNMLEGARPESVYRRITSRLTRAKARGSKTGQAPAPDTDIAKSDIDDLDGMWILDGGENYFRFDGITLEVVWSEGREVDAGNGI